MKPEKDVAIVLNQLCVSGSSEFIFDYLQFKRVQEEENALIEKYDKDWAKLSMTIRNLQDFPKDVKSNWRFKWLSKIPNKLLLDVMKDAVHLQIGIILAMISAKLAISLMSMSLKNVNSKYSISKEYESGVESKIKELEKMEIKTNVHKVSSLESLKNIFKTAKGVSLNRFVLIDYFSPKCPPCMKAMPEFEKLSQDYTSVEFYKVDVSEPAERWTPGFRIG